MAFNLHIFPHPPCAENLTTPAFAAIYEDTAMEISGLNKFNAFAFPLPGKDDSGSTPAAVQDVVNLSTPQMLEDHEVDAVMDETLNMIAHDNVAALSVHGGLSQSRVFALLGM